MNYLLLIVEPKGQRQARTLDEGQAAYGAMQRFAEDLKARGQFLACDSLLGEERGTRVERRGGQLRTLDGPFSETKEMVGGYFLIDCASREEALAAAAACPAAEWATVEVRPVGPCFA